MRYRKFGRTDWQVSEICFGAWQLGGTWGAIDKKESMATLHSAFEQGINLVDTAAA
jgi:aryl-alcohol dehydrogenase-like predicted oxidoreductase